jgi:uncharacterized protein YqeY
MNLKDQITEDMKAAMRARQSERLSAIRLLLAAVKQREVDDRVQADDALVTTVVERLIKQRRDSVAQFDQAGRRDLADRERAEIAVLSVYLPVQASAQEIETVVAAAIAECGAAGPQDMGKVMALVKPRLAGRADMAAVSAAVRAGLGARAA